MIMEVTVSDQIREKRPIVYSSRWFSLGYFAARTLIVLALGLFVLGVAWNYSTRRYLKGFADAIVPLTGSPEEKTEALVEWFHHEPQRLVPPIAGSAGPIAGPRPCEHRPECTLAESLWIGK